jgi:hypothetical protein
MDLNFRGWLIEEENKADTGMMPKFYNQAPIDWENDTSKEIIDKIYSVPCQDVPQAVGHGVVATFGDEDLKDLVCTIKGEKKVAWLKGNKLDHPGSRQRKVLTMLLKTALDKGLAVVPQDYRGGIPGWIVGPPSVVNDMKSLADLHDRFTGAQNVGQNTKNAPEVNVPAHLHRLVGRALGYNPADIEEFLKGHANATCPGGVCDSMNDPKIRPELEKAGKKLFAPNPRIGNVRA